MDKICTLINEDNVINPHRITFIVEPNEGIKTLSISYGGVEVDLVTSPRRLRPRTDVEARDELEQIVLKEREQRELGMKPSLEKLRLYCEPGVVFKSGVVF